MTVVIDIGPNLYNVIGGIVIAILLVFAVRAIFKVP